MVHWLTISTKPYRKKVVLDWIKIPVSLAAIAVIENNVT
jgi:hypothetical protein